MAAAKHSYGTPFVGRERELSMLRGALEGADGGRGRLVLLVGDPGIGKTSLAEQLCAEATGRGAICLWGRCWEGGGAPAYFPWIEILRAYRRRGGGDALADLAELTRLLPEHAPASAAGNGAPQSEQLRFRLFESFTEFFTRLVGTFPPVDDTGVARAAVLVLDDLHWADADSLLLLRFLARELPNLPLLVLGSYRPQEVRMDTALARLLGDLNADSQRVFLSGLSAAEVRIFVEQLWNRPVAGELIESVHRVTEGNPFFVDEVVRLMMVQGAPPESAATVRIPAELREVIERRLAPMSTTARTALTHAATIGQHFDAALLARVVPLGESELLVALDELERAGVLTRLEDANRYRFTHTLVHQTLYESMAPAERIALHRAIAAALERAGEHPAAAIAHHYLECVLARSDPDERADDIRRAVAYAGRAGQEALAQLAFEHAASYYQRALQALGHLLQAIPAERGVSEQQCEVLLALGDAQRRAGELGRARASFSTAARLTRALADGGPLFARAAVGFGAASAETGAIDDELIRLLEEALNRVGPDDSALRVGLLGRLARALYFTPALVRRLELSREAVEVARRLDDPQATAAALLARHFALWGPGTTAERLEVAAELIALAERSGDTELELEARVWRIVDLIEAGDGHALALETDYYNKLAERARLPRYRWLGSILLTMRALCREPLAGVQAQVQAALALGRRCEIGNAEQFFLVQWFCLQQALGRGAELRDEIVRLLERFPALQIWRSALALIEAETGQTAAAQRELVQLGQQDFADLPRDGNWLPALARLAETSVVVGDRQRGTVLYQLLEPYAACNIVVATGVVLLGSVSHYLGMLAQMLGRWEDALRHFELALAMHERLGAQSLLAVTQWRCAQLLRELPEPRPQRAHELEAAAQLTAERLGLTALLADLERAPARPPTAPARPTAIAPAAAREEGALFRREGDIWHLRFAGQAVRLRDTKGLRIVHQLLRHPGERLAATQLALAAADEEDRSGLVSAVAEQLRVNVTRAVNATLRRIAADHPELGRHLSGAVRTGQRCVYSPPGGDEGWDLGE